MARCGSAGDRCLENRSSQLLPPAVVLRDVERRARAHDADIRRRHPDRPARDDVVDLPAATGLNEEPTCTRSRVDPRERDVAPVTCPAQDVEPGVAQRDALEFAECASAPRPFVLAGRACAVAGECKRLLRGEDAQALTEYARSLDGDRAGRAAELRRERAQTPTPSSRWLPKADEPDACPDGCSDGRANGGRGPTCVRPVDEVRVRCPSLSAAREQERDRARRGGDRAKRTRPTTRPLRVEPRPQPVHPSRRTPP